MLQALCDALGERGWVEEDLLPKMRTPPLLKMMGHRHDMTTEAEV